MPLPILSEAKKANLLNHDFPIRVHAVAFGYIMCHLIEHYPSEQPFYFCYGDAPSTRHLQISLSGHLLANAARSMAIIETCTLLFFLGIKMKAKQLIDRGNDHGGEVVIEQFGILDLPLTSLTVDCIRQKVVPKIPEIEDHILAVFKIRNKNVAHLDAEFQNENRTRGMAQTFLLVLHYMEVFYQELGRSPIIYLDQFIPEVDRFVKEQKAV